MIGYEPDWGGGTPYVYNKKYGNRTYLSIRDEVNNPVKSLDDFMTRFDTTFKIDLMHEIDDMVDLQVVEKFALMYYYIIPKLYDKYYKGKTINESKEVIIERLINKVIKRTV
jgi:hypothetical protein